MQGLLALIDQPAMKVRSTMTEINSGVSTAGMLSHASEIEVTVNTHGISMLGSILSPPGYGSSCLVGSLIVLGESSIRYQRPPSAPQSDSYTFDHSFQTMCPYAASLRAHQDAGQAMDMEDMLETPGHWECPTQ